MSEERNDLLPYILVFKGPRKEEFLRLMATDMGKNIEKWHEKTMTISHWAKLDPRKPTSILAVSERLKGIVNHKTLVRLLESLAAISRSLDDGLPAVWVTADGLAIGGMPVVLIADPS